GHSSKICYNSSTRVSIKQLMLLVFFSAISIAMAFNHQGGNKVNERIGTRNAVSLTTSSLQSTNWD
ncbi:MAG: hypothetical protein ACON5J_14190, partial [Rubripirellula sp.]